MTFFRTLFEPGELTCFSDTLKDTHLRLATQLPDEAEPMFFVINPLHTSRADRNVTVYRNILIEFDDRPISEQLELIKSLNLPYSTLVFSGGKSLHAIISLDTPVASDVEYKSLVKAIYNKIPGIDKANSNPSRFSRVADSKRDNGVKQELIDLKPRVSLEQLKTWIGPIEMEKPQIRVVNNSRMIPIRVEHFLKFGAQEGSRNTLLFMHSCELARAGFSEEEVIEMVGKVLELPDWEIKRTVRSAFADVRGK